MKFNANLHSEKRFGKEAHHDAPPYRTVSRNGARRIGVTLVLLAWIISALACSRSVGAPGWQAATQWSMQLTAVVPPSSTPTEVQPSATPDSTPIQPGAAVTPGPSPTGPTPTQNTATPAPIELYYTQAGDTVPALAKRFNVSADQITSPDLLPAVQLLPSDQLLLIPDVLPETSPPDKLLPDSEVVFSPSAIGFDIDTFVKDAGGYLSTFRQYLPTGWYSGAQVVQRVAIENSINPRLLLSLLEYRSHWVYGQPTNLAEEDYPLGFLDQNHKGLYGQLSLAVQQLSIGYYGWRAGILTDLTFPYSQNSTLRIAPELNAGSVALQVLFSKLYNQRDWGGALYTPDSFPALHERMFGNPWLRAETVEPLYPTNLTQPVLELPYAAGHTWSFSGGPHSAWGPDGALASLDFAPGSMSSGCVSSDEWITASASGLVVREDEGLVVVDLDADGYEQSGWTMIYLHVAAKGRVAVGTLLNTNDKIGHPSCEGGSATGTHVHVARKYNGEWILADGPIPFVLSGWTAHAGNAPYKGTMTKDDIVVTANTYGSFETLVYRPLDTTETN